MKGRCAGCGYTDSARKVSLHIMTPCPRWVALWAEDPALALDPEAEYERWAREDRQAEKDQAREEKVAATNAARDAMADRFATRNILEV